MGVDSKSYRAQIEKTEIAGINEISIKGSML